ncbi:MAG TPA: hypothetical protein VK698_23745 [Kofleriaceae bacterium]|nr:hypothetical protein [Kofleriaceae bacterium]
MSLRLIAVAAAAALGCSSPNQADRQPRPPAAHAPLIEHDAASTAPASRCIPAGTYAVHVDLSSATITQQNTGMGDTVWCKSILEAVPAQMMASMTIRYTDGRPEVDWSGSKSLTMTGDCQLEITAPPMPTRITFVAGKGTGTTTYSTGTPNHPDESCTATNAVLTVELAAAR